MPGIEPVPGVVVLAGVLRALDPFHAADRHDVRAVGQERRRLPGLPSSPQSISSHVGAMPWKCSISPCISVAVRLVGRIGDDRIGRAVMVERKRILAAADVAGIDAAQAEGFQCRTSAPSPAHGSAKVRMPRGRCGISGSTAARGVG